MNEHSEFELCGDATQTQEDDPLAAFLAAVTPVDAVLQQFYRLSQRNALPNFIQDDWEDEPSLLDAPVWAKQFAWWQSAIPEFSFARGSRLAQFAEYYQLTHFELTVVITGCLNAFEPRYQKLFSGLPFQQYGRPTPELVMAVFCPGTYTRHMQQQSFSAEAPLLRYGLIELTQGKGAGITTFETAEWARLWLLGEYCLPSHLVLYARWLESPSQTVSPELTVVASQDSLPPLIEVRHVCGLDNESELATLAQLMGTRALWVSWSQLLLDERNAIRILRELLNLHRLWGILLVISLDAPGEGDDIRQASLRLRLEQVVTQAGKESPPVPFCCVLPSDAPQFPFPSLSRWSLNLALPDAETRHAQLLTLLDTPDPCWDTHRLVQQIALSFEEMRNAVHEAQSFSHRRGDTIVRGADYRQAFLRRSRKNFGQLAHRITPQRNWDDIVVSDDLQDELQDIVRAIRWCDLHQESPRIKSRNTGISALFHGAPGTGKTLVAEVLAGELGVDLIRVDLSTVVNKYIGETEKNLGRIFDLAARDAGVLFFDEADALFGKRSDSKDAKDRHANIEVAYLLQRLEQHPGLVILATNNRSHLDDAFTRRFSFITHFLWPDAALREKMWLQSWPAGQPLAPDVDFFQLAQIQLTGANIRNIAQQASWLAAEAPCVGTAHIEKALRREMAKMGRSV